MWVSAEEFIGVHSSKAEHVMEGLRDCAWHLNVVRRKRGDSLEVVDIGFVRVQGHHAHQIRLAYRWKVSE
jgi:hypothetical protein